MEEGLFMSVSRRQKAGLICSEISKQELEVIHIDSHSTAKWHGYHAGLILDD